MQWLKRWAIVLAFALLPGSGGTGLVAQGLAISMPDFVFSGIPAADMKDYVDALAYQLGKRISEMQTDAGYPEGRVTRVSDGESVTSAAPGVLAFALSGSLKKTEDGYSLAVLLVDETGRRIEGLERTYRDDRQLYSDCIDVSRSLAQACLGEQDRVMGSRPLFGAAFVFGYARAELAEGGDGTKYGIQGLIMPRAGGSWAFGLDLSVVDFGVRDFRTPSQTARDYLFDAEIWAAWLYVISVGANFSYSLGPLQSAPYLGFSLGLLKYAPFFLFGLDGPSLTFRWNLASGGVTLGVEFGMTLGFRIRQP